MHQARQQLNFMVRQRTGIVHYPDARGGQTHLAVHGLLYRGVHQHLIEACQQRLRTGWKIDFDGDLWSRLTQATYQHLAVVIKNRFMRTDH